MSPKFYNLIAILAGIICGLITASSFFLHSWTSIFPWVGVGLLVAYFSPNRRSAILGGALFGFLTIATWLLRGFHGTSAQMKGLITIIVISGAIAAVVGAVGSFIFRLLLKKFKLRQKQK